jgi:putative membrane protein
MTQEALLAYAHLLAILTMVVFLSSEAALCRSEWLNAAVVERLCRLDLIYSLAAAAVFLTGLARVFAGVKGAEWYGLHPLLHLKLALFVVVALLSIQPTRSFKRWRESLRSTGELPDAQQVRQVRRRVMVEAHLVAVIPLVAVFLARGFGARG